MSIIKKYNVSYHPEKAIRYSKHDLPLSDTPQNSTISTNDQKEKQLAELKNEKKKIIESTKLKAKEILQKAKEEAELIKTDAYAKAHDKGYVRGYEEGFEKGYKEKHADLEKSLADVATAKKINNEIYQDYIYQAEEDILEIIVTLTEKITNQELSVNRDIINNLVTEAIEKCTKREKIVARVSENNFSTAEENKYQIIQKTTGLETLKIFADKDLSDNEVIIETPYGDISNSLDAKLENIKDSLKSMIKRLRNNSE